MFNGGKSYGGNKTRKEAMEWGSGKASLNGMVPNFMYYLFYSWHPIEEVTYVNHDCCLQMSRVGPESRGAFF